MNKNVILKKTIGYDLFVIFNLKKIPVHIKSNDVDFFK